MSWEKQWQVIYFYFLFFLQHTSLHHYLEAFLHSTVFTEHLLLRIPGTVLDVGVGGVDKLRKSPYCGVLHFIVKREKKQLTNRPVGETYYRKIGKG